MNTQIRKGALQVRVLIIVGIVMATIYFLLGVWLILSDIVFFKLAAKQQRLLGIMLIVYSLYRSYMLYLRYFKSKKLVDNEDSGTSDM